jgi:hypothetical protein
MYPNLNQYGNTKGTNQEKNEMLKSIYKSAIRAPYFQGFNNPEFVKKSRLQVLNNVKEDEKEIDETTFRMMKAFKRPEKSFIACGKNGRVML